MRAFVVCCMAMPPMFVLLWNSQTILSLIIPHADPEMISLAALYVKITSLGVPVCSIHGSRLSALRNILKLQSLQPLAGFECLRRYLSSMGLLKGPTMAYVITAPLSIALTYYLTFEV